MNHYKDCCRTVSGSIAEYEHAALRDIRPITDHYKSPAWTTALAIVRERMAVAQERAADMSVFPADYDSRAYAEVRHDMARDILAEMEERGKP